jgi:hypothetical protein
MGALAAVVVVPAVPVLVVSAGAGLMVVYIVHASAGHYCGAEREWVRGVYLRRVDADAFVASCPTWEDCGIDYVVQEHEVVVKADSGAFGKSSVG